MFSPGGCMPLLLCLRFISRGCLVDKAPNLPWTSAVPTWCLFKAGNWSVLLVYFVVRVLSVFDFFYFLFFPLSDMCQGIKAGYRSITSFCRPVSVWLTASDTQGFRGLECWQSNSAFHSHPPIYSCNRPFPGLLYCLLFPIPPFPPLPRPHRYHSRPASAFYSFPWGERCPWSVGKSFWCLRGPQYLISAQSALFYYLRKSPASPLLQGENAHPGRKGISGNV